MAEGSCTVPRVNSSIHYFMHSILLSDSFLGEEVRMSMSQGGAYLHRVVAD